MHTLRRSLLFSVVTLLLFLSSLMLSMDLAHEHHPSVKHTHSALACSRNPVSCLAPTGGFESLEGM